MHHPTHIRLCSTTKGETIMNKEEYRKNSWKYQALTRINTILQKQPKGLTSTGIYHELTNPTHTTKRLQKTMTPRKLTRLLVKEIPYYKTYNTETGHYINTYTLNGE